MITPTYILGLAISTLLGFVVYFIALKSYPLTSLSKSPRHVRRRARQMVVQAQLQQQHIRSQKQQQSHKQLQHAREELSDDLEALKEAAQQSEELLTAQHSEVQREEHRVSQKESQAQELAQLSGKSHRAYEQTLTCLTESQIQLQDVLEQKAGVEARKLKNALVDDIVDQKSIRYQKVLKALEAEMVSSARKKAHLLLSHVHSRYTPEFVWPKISNAVIETRPGEVEKYLARFPHMIEQLSDLSGCEVTPLSRSSSGDPGTESSESLAPAMGLKFAGGFGIHREAAKQTFAQLLRRQSSGNLTLSTYQKHLSALNRQARQLGKRAITDLKLYDIHPEIQYLIGALNWRTSYRQNQWLHTMEVAVLAGLIASELGVDAQTAKRCGLLHDIGKALDYRIEGSHAVISGDYADRFGEDKVVCDTVMSHHNDLLVENPLAFTLIAADTLSGARPGARVNLEEGYQTRLSGITEAAKSFPGVHDLAIMNGGREVHVHVNHKMISEDKARKLARDIARKIEQDVSYPSHIKIQVSRVFESQAVA